MYKIGMSKDIHLFTNDKEFVLGGVKIAFDKGFLAHSDGDVLIHAIVESIIGALGIGDIGTLFPDSNPDYKNISSVYFLKEVKKLLEENKYEIVNIDSLVIIDKPNLSPYKKMMEENIAHHLGIDYTKVNVKATRTEGYFSNSDGAIANAICLIKKIS